jgi:GH15 family glucan-1,4-alpha-glucosidase
MSCPVDIDINGSDATARFTVREGDSIGFALRWGPLSLPPPAPTASGDVAERLEDCKAAWRDWESEHDIYEGPSRDTIMLSSRVLKGLTFRPTGAIVAAPTTSLPETIGGDRNWDYRFAWIRDSSLTLEALWVGTCSDEVDNSATTAITNSSLKDRRTSTTQGSSDLSASTWTILGLAVRS